MKPEIFLDLVVLVAVAINAALTFRLLSILADVMAELQRHKRERHETKEIKNENAVGAEMLAVAVQGHNRTS